MSNIHTDMALEAHEYFTGKKGAMPNSIKVTNRRFGGISYSDITVTDKAGADYLEKPIGTYITIETEDMRGEVRESYNQNRNFIAGEIEKLLEKNNIEKDAPVLVVGLGNWDITPDALGPKTVSSLFVSRHLFEHMPKLAQGHMRPVSAISPGVLGTTGIETVEIVKGIVQRTQPKCVIAIDALVARSITRLGKSVQLSDSGINPGSGVGNHRKGLNYDTLRIPVISIGVPMVVSGATIADNAFEGSVENLKKGSSQSKKFYDMLSSLNTEDRKAIFAEALSGLTGELIVTPKDIDELVTDISDMLSSALNLGLHPTDVAELLQ